MRKLHKKTYSVGRRLMVLLLLCGLLLPIYRQVHAATVVYEYEWIKDVSGLPKDNEWHDYFLAWEDLGNSRKVWFTDYHWYTPDGDSNIDEGGSSWMEYRAASTLPNNSAEKFTSKDALGHMQIKYAGQDPDNSGAPMYYIRVSKMNGGYSYFTDGEPTNNEKDATKFTFEDHGSVFHIYANVSGIDRYLTRDYEYLETTYRTSAGGGENYRHLRVYHRTFTIEQDEEVDIDGEIRGKVDVLECYRITKAKDILELAQSNKGWQDVIIAWDDAYSANHSDKNTVWYTKEIWYENDKPNYANDFDGSDRYAYWSDGLLGDGYTSPTADSFVIPEKVGHFQIKYVDRDSGNNIQGEKDANGNSISSPRFNIRFALTSNQYFYLARKSITTKSEDADQYTFQLFASGDNAGYLHIFGNWPLLEDEYLSRYGNRFALQEHNYSDDWQYYFRLYAYRTVQYDGIVKSFTVGKGATYSIDDRLVLHEGVTITVEDGGVLTVDQRLLNNGTILVKEGGTVIVNEGGCIMPYKESADSKLILDGGNLIVMDNAQVLCDTKDATLVARNGATIINRGLLMVGKVLELRNNSYLRNESTGYLVFGGKVTRERGSVTSLSVSKMESNITNGSFTYLCSMKSKLTNYGTISLPKNIDPSWSDESFKNLGTIHKR